MEIGFNWRRGPYPDEVLSGGLHFELQERPPNDAPISFLLKSRYGSKLDLISTSLARVLLPLIFLPRWACPAGTGNRLKSNA